MGLSETILAAIIGALATIVTAVFQLVRNRSPSESKPKKNRMRSLLATVALSVACIVGGYAWSSLRAVNAKDEMRSTMEAEFTRLAQAKKTLNHRKFPKREQKIIVAFKGDVKTIADEFIPVGRL